MKSIEVSTGQFEIVPVASVSELDKQTRDSAIATYRKAFAGEPYNEAFTPDEAEAALDYITEQDGKLILGKLGGEAIAIAGGYRKPDGTFYIEELAVTPEQQGKGYGKTTLEALLDTNDAQQAGRLEIRTTTVNSKAVSLYESEGFMPENGTEVVAQIRQDGNIALDERIYLSKPPLPEKERLATLKRAAIAYPSGNTTAVVFDQMLDSNRKTLNEKVMQSWRSQSPDQPKVEQCCFVTMPSPDSGAVAKVEMFGGEFCGNATRSAVWLITGGQDFEGTIEVSGVHRPLDFRVQDGEVTVAMPLPENGELAQPVAEGTIVQLEGIVQLVVTAPKNNQTPRQLLDNILRTNKYDLGDQSAIGISYYDTTSGKAEFCVWVKAVDTIFDETACGSGTSAIGVALATKARESIALNVVQPSGESITTTAAYTDGKVVESSISGTVDVLYDGELRLS